MRILVPASRADCPAALALTSEGLQPEVVVMRDDQHYGRLLADVWSAGRGFILVEHDVAPWPGAISELADCPELYCGYGYPTRGTLIYSLGCVKFSDTLVRRFPSLPRQWVGQHWSELDGQVNLALVDALGTADAHMHSPPCAHVRRSAA